MSGEITGPPSVDFYTMLSGLGDTYRAVGKARREQALRDSFSDGLPKAADGSIDYGATGDILSKNGADIGHLLTIANLAEAQRKSRDELAASREFRGQIGGIVSGGDTPAPPIAAQPAALPGQPRAPVQPSAKAWGDKEAEDAGLYDKPAPKMVSFGDALSGKRPDPYEGMRTPPDQPQQAALPVQPRAPVVIPDKGLDLSDKIPALIAASSNPRLPQQDRDTAKVLLQHALGQNKDSDAFSAYQRAVKQGFPGTEMDYQKALKSPTVSIDQRGESEETKAAGKAAGERRAAMFDAANGATKNLANLTRVQTLMDQVDQGKLAPGRMSVSAWAKSLGVNDDFAKNLGLDPAKVGDAQALQAMTNELVLGKIGAGGLPANNFSDADRQFLTDTLPKLGNDPRANKILIEAARRVHQDSIQRALDYQSWRDEPGNKGRSFEDFELQRARKIAQMDRFGDLRKQAQTLVDAGPAPPASAPQQQPANPWQDVSPGVRIRERQ